MHTPRSRNVVAIRPAPRRKPLRRPAQQAHPIQMPLRRPLRLSDKYTCFRVTRATRITSTPTGVKAVRAPFTSRYALRHPSRSLNSTNDPSARNSGSWASAVGSTVERRSVLRARRSRLHSEQSRWPPASCRPRPCRAKPPARRSPLGASATRPPAPVPSRCISEQAQPENEGAASLGANTNPLPGPGSWRRTRREEPVPPIVRDEF